MIPLSPLVSWVLVGGLIALGTFAAYLVAVWITDADDRKWKSDAERWQRAREELDRD